MHCSKQNQPSDSVHRYRSKAQILKPIFRDWLTQQVLFGSTLINTSPQITNACGYPLRPVLSRNQFVITHLLQTATGMASCNVFRFGVSSWWRLFQSKPKPGRGVKRWSRCWNQVSLPYSTALKYTMTVQVRCPPFLVLWSNSLVPGENQSVCCLKDSPGSYRCPWMGSEKRGSTPNKSVKRWSKRRDSTGWLWRRWHVRLVR